MVHAGNITAAGDNYYTFTTGSAPGTYTIGLTSTQSDLGWGLFSDTNSPAFVICDGPWSGAHDEICSASLTANTLYYLKVVEFDGTAGSFTLTIAPPSSNPYPGEGSPYSPLDLGTVATSSLVHAGNVAAAGASYYTFTTGSAPGTYTIGLTNTQSDLGWGLFSDPYTPAFVVCDEWLGAHDEICTASLTANTLSYLEVVEWDGTAGSYTLTIAPPMSLAVAANVTTIAGQGKVPISWDAVADARSYNGNRSARSGAGTAGAKMSSITKNRSTSVLYYR